MPMIKRLICLAVAVGCGAVSAIAADMTSSEVTKALFKSDAGHVVDLSTKDLRELDLAGVDFKGAKLSNTKMYGVELAGANLEGADLRDSVLDRAVITKTNFKNANLENVTLLRVSIFTGLERNIAEAPSFAGANMKNTKMSGWWDGSNFEGADLTGAVFGQPDGYREGLLASRMRLTSANFKDATLKGADFTGNQLTHARFTNAKAAGAIFTGADLTMADFTGADVTGMDVTGANLAEAKFDGAMGVITMKGLSTALNAQHVVP
jgi:uncharacterized protein YjbI with pentapeptide repeats